MVEFLKLKKSTFNDVSSWFSVEKPPCKLVKPYGAQESDQPKRVQVDEQKKGRRQVVCLCSFIKSDTNTHSPLIQGSLSTIKKKNFPQLNANFHIFIYDPQRFHHVHSFR